VHTRPGLVLVLLVFSIFINYVDRGSLSVAAPVLSKELGLNSSSLGLLFSAFFWTYAAFLVVAGWLVDRFSVKWVYAAGFFVWSVATLATGFTHGLTALLICRLLLGAGESVAYPACSRILARHVPEERRGMANAWIDLGSKAGPALSTLIGGLIVEQYGWRVLFWGAGVASLLWLPAWLAGFHEEPRTTPYTAKIPSPSFGEILRRREAWGTSLGMFSLGYVWYFLLSWLPSYLVQERGYDLRSMAVLGALPFAGTGAATLTAAWVSDRLIRRGLSPTRVRRTALMAGLVLCGFFLVLAAAAQDRVVSLVLLVVAHLALGVYTANVWAVTQTLAGAAAAGRWSGIQNAVGNLGGVASPLITGVVVDRTGSFFFAFCGAAAVGALGALAYWFWVPRVEPVRWRSAPAAAAVES
jgi:ACS family D-galactonate transporter-like MFS transporter